MTPRKKVRRRRTRKRVQTSTTISSETKIRIMEMARTSGRTQSQVLEALIDNAFAYRDLTAAMRHEDLIATTRRAIEEIHRGNVEAELHRLGFTRGLPTVDANGKVSRAWLEPSDPRASPRSGFVPWREGEQPQGEVVVEGDEGGGPEPGK